MTQERDLKYVKESLVSKRLTGKYRKPTGKKFKGLIEDINNTVDQILTKVELSEQQVRQASKMGLK